MTANAAVPRKLAHVANGIDRTVCSVQDVADSHISDACKTS